MTEQRRTCRVPLDIYLNKYLDGVPYMTRTADISRDGVRLAHLIEPQTLGRSIGLQFQLPGSDEVIYAEGEVVREWADLDEAEEGSGVRFTLVTERHRRLIAQYMERHIPAS